MGTNCVSLVVDMFSYVMRKALCYLFLTIIRLVLLRRSILLQVLNTEKSF